MPLTGNFVKKLKTALDNQMLELSEARAEIAFDIAVLEKMIKNRENWPFHTWNFGLLSPQRNDNTWVGKEKKYRSRNIGSDPIDAT